MQIWVAISQRFSDFRVSILVTTGLKCRFGRTSRVFFSFLFGRYFGSIMKGKVGLSLNFYFGEQTFLRVSS